MTWVWPNIGPDLIHEFWAERAFELCDKSFPLLLEMHSLLPLVLQHDKMRLQRHGSEHPSSSGCAAKIAIDRSARTSLNPSMPMDVAKLSRDLIIWSGIRSHAAVRIFCRVFAASMQSLTDRIRTVKLIAAIGLQNNYTYG